MARLLVLATVLWGVIGSFQVASAEGPTVVYLSGGRDSRFPDGTGSYEGLLARELVRQALLCAARDELSCSTLDVHLGQQVPAGIVPFDMVVVRGRGGDDPQPTELKLLRGEPSASEEVVREVIKPKSPVDIVDLVRMFEARSRGSFVRHLQQAGVAGQPRTWVKKSLPSDEANGALAQMSFVAQFRAACLLHSDIERKGRSPELIAALSRAYANLAVLTEPHWSPAHKVFAARSLLYSQRLVAGKHDNTIAYSARAYAFALAGLHQAALDDLDALERLILDGKAKRTELQSILRSFCMFRMTQLDSARCEAQHAELVRVLRLVAREHGGSTRQVIEEAFEVTGAMPHCYRAQHSLVQHSGVSLGHMTTIQGPVNTGKTLYPALLEFVAIPQDVRSQLAPPMKGMQDPADEFNRRAKAIGAFQGCEDFVGRQGQLTWQVLGQLLADHSFAELYARVRFESKLLSVDADRFLDQIKPLYATHPMAPVMDFLRRDPAASLQAVTRSKLIDLDTTELQARDLAAVVPKDATAEVSQRKQAVANAVLKHMDYTAGDLLRRYPRWPARESRDAERAYRISPYAPAIRSHMIAHHWKKIEPELDQWLRDAEGDAAQLAAIGTHYSDEKEWTKALKYLQKARELSPENETIRRLADTYKAKGEPDKWQSTLEELLLHPDFGLEHAKIRVEIADYYITRHEFEKALPFALQAANTGAEWALLAAAQCYEALQKWNEAEELYRTAAQGYDDFHWFCFTQRTGHGDAEAARQLAYASLAGHGGAKVIPIVRYFILRIIGEHQQARIHLEDLYKKTPDLLPGLHLALLADEQRDFDRLKAVMAELRTAAAARSPGAPPVGLAALIQAISADLAAGGKVDFDPRALSAAKDGAPPNEVGPFDYLLGKYLQLHGKPKAAEEIWLMRMCRNNMIHFHRTLCGIELRAFGVGPEAYKKTLQIAIPEDQSPDAPPR